MTPAPGVARVRVDDEHARREAREANQLPLVQGRVDHDVPGRERRVLHGVQEGLADRRGHEAITTRPEILITSSPADHVDEPGNNASKPRVDPARFFPNKPCGDHLSPKTTLSPLELPYLLSAAAHPSLLAPSRRFPARPVNSLHHIPEPRIFHP